MTIGCNRGFCEALQARLYLKSQFSTVTTNVTYNYKSAANAAAAIYIALLSSDLRVCDYKYLENRIFQ